MARVLAQPCQHPFGPGTRSFQQAWLSCHQSLQQRKLDLCGLFEATGRFCTRCGAIFDVQTGVAVQDEMESLDGSSQRYSKMKMFRDFWSRR